jgi:cytochrome c biogenesis protein CcdA
MTWQIFAEGVTSIVLPCSWILLVPPILVVLSTAGDRSVAAGASGGVVLALMARAAGGAIPGDVVGLIAGPTLLLGVVLAARTSLRWPGGALVALAGGMLWQPCVGPQLGAILGLTAADQLAASLRMIPFAVGIVLPVAAAGFTIELAPDVAQRRIAVIGSVSALVAAVAIFAGLHAPVVGIFARWSLEVPV